MLGAVAGDIVGSIYEHRTIKTKDFSLFGEGCTFTDDTVLSVAVADCLMHQGDFADFLRAYSRRYPDAGYGAMFREWVRDKDKGAYNSYGNGSAMRVGPIAYVAGSEDEALDLAARSSAVTHDHPDAVAGAQAVALVMWLARRGKKKGAIRKAVSQRFGYDLTPTVEQIRPGYGYDITAAGTVPPAIICALRATDFEDAVRNAVSLGGDADTLACIAGGIAEILYGIPAPMARKTLGYLDGELERTVRKFRKRYVGGESLFSRWF